MMEFLREFWTFLLDVEWLRVFVTVIFTAIAVVAGIWWPARLLEAHTNQPLVRWGWYVVGTFALVMIYLAMYGYGHFWNLYHDSEFPARTPPANAAVSAAFMPPANACGARR